MSGILREEDALNKWNYFVCYCNCVYMILCTCQNLFNFTVQRVNLHVCKYFKNHLGGQGNPRMEWTMLQINITLKFMKQPHWREEGNGADLSNFAYERGL